MPRLRSRFQIFGMLFAISMTAFGLALILVGLFLLPMLHRTTTFGLGFWVALGLFLLSFLAVALTSIGWIAAVRELPRTDAPPNPLARAR